MSRTLSPKKLAHLALARIPSTWQPTAQSSPSPISLPQHPPPWFSESPSRTPLARIQLGGGSLCKASDQVALCTPPQCSRSHPQTDQATHRRTPPPPLASLTCWWPQQSTADLPFHPSMCSSGIFSCSQIISAFGLNGYIYPRSRYFVHLIYIHIKIK